MISLKKTYRLLVIFVLMSGFLVGFTSGYGIDYKYSHFPMSIENRKYKNINGLKYLRYEGEVSEFTKTTSIDVPMDYINDIGYFKFFKLGHYWDKGPDQIENDDIDLSRLTDRKLQYPIIGLHVYDHMIMFIHRGLLTQDEKDEIGSRYTSKDFNIIKKGRWYITSSDVRRPNDYTYSASDYTSLAKSLYSNELVTFQMGQNPYNRYDIEGFGDHLLQLELKSGRNSLVGLVLSLQQLYGSKALSTNYSYDKFYQRDRWVANELMYSRDAIKEFYTRYGNLPTGLTHLNQMGLAFDSRELGKYGHELMSLNKLDYRCYQLGFKPKSNDFKKLHRFDINNDGYRIGEFCIN